jgi:hypothetical protein
LWVGLALIASWLSIRTAISVALVEIVVGALAGNLLLCIQPIGSISWRA